MHMDQDKDTKRAEESGSDQTTQNIVDFGSAMTKTAHGTVYTLAIIGQIEGHVAAPNGTKTTRYAERSQNEPLWFLLQRQIAHFKKMRRFLKNS